ncbi:MAG: hypothetical protein PVJ80_10470 [Gemmatimonadota bacterium]|jgi:hypothetical protein
MDPSTEALVWTRPGRLAVLVSVAALACSGASTSNEALPPTLDDLPIIGATEELRIGSVDDPALGFSNIASVDVDEAGRVYVLDALDMQIRVYGPDGSLLGRLGRRGDGPGEFARPPIVGVLGDTVWAVDFAGGRITRFRRTGELLGTAPVEVVLVRYRLDL